MRVEFAQTPRMSTYLVAWVVAPFQAVSAETETNKINVSVVTSREKIDQVDILSYMQEAPRKTEQILESRLNHCLGLNTTFSGIICIGCRCESDRKLREIFWHQVPPTKTGQVQLLLYTCHLKASIKFKVQLCSVQTRWQYQTSSLMQWRIGG